MTLFIRFLVLVVLLGAAGAGAYALMQRETAVEVVRPVRGKAVQAVYATGTVEPGTMLPIAPRTAAHLTSLLADEGQTVIKGQILAQLEDDDLRQSLKEAQAKAALTEKDLARKVTLRKSGTVAQQAVDQARAERDAAVAAVDRVKAQLAFLQLKSPDAGIIIRRDGEVGELIPANQPVFWLACCTPLRVEAEVDEEDITLVKIGLPVAVGADAFPGQVFHGKVHSITPKGDPVARSYRVHIVFDEPTPLMIGMTAEANIIIRTKDGALMVPRSAVTAGHVWTVQDGQLARVAVTTGIITPKAIEITGGLADSGQVVQTPDAEFEDGARVRPVLSDWKGE